MYFWKNVRDFVQVFPSLAPTGRYKVETKLSTNGNDFFNFIHTSDIEHKLLIDW